MRGRREMRMMRTFAAAPPNKMGGEEEEEVEVVETKAKLGPVSPMEHVFANAKFQVRRNMGKVNF